MGESEKQAFFYRYIELIVSRIYKGKWNEKVLQLILFLVSVDIFPGGPYTPADILRA